MRRVAQGFQCHLFLQDQPNGVWAAERGLALGFGVDASGEARPWRARVVRRWHRSWRGGIGELVRG